jgi:hypothetical protein
MTAIAVLARYLWRTIWPLSLSADYSWSQIPLAIGNAFDWLSVAVVAIAVIAVILAFRHSRLAFFCGAFAFISLLPASNLLFPTGTIMAERLLYLPSTALVAILVLAIENATSHLPRPAFAVLVICGFLATAYSVRTFFRNPDWHDDYAMAEAIVKASPASFKGHALMADFLLKTDPSPANVARAVAEAEKSVAILDSLPGEMNVTGPWNIAARAHLMQGTDIERAARFAERSAHIEMAGRAAWNREHGANNPEAPSAAESYRLAASAHLRLGRPEQALSEATHAKNLDPSSPEVYADIAEALVAVRRVEDAAIALIEGMSVTGNAQLRQDLLELYAKGGVDTEGCAVTTGPNGPALNPDCPVVRRDFCTAAARVRRQDVLEQFGCGR